MKGLSARAAAATIAALAALAAGAAIAPAAAACPVCYGQAQAPIFDGARWSVIFLGGLAYALMGGAAAVVIALRRRVRANLEHGPTVPPLPFRPADSPRVKES